MTYVLRIGTLGNCRGTHIRVPAVPRLRRSVVARRAGQQEPTPQTPRQLLPVGLLVRAGVAGREPSDLGRDRCCHRESSTAVEQLPPANAAKCVHGCLTLTVASPSMR